MADGHRPLIAHYEARSGDIVAAIQRLASIESPSFDIAALELCATELAAYIEEMTGLQPRWCRGGDEKRPHLRLDLGDRPDVLMIGHFDTVHPMGTLAAHPIRMEGDRLYGPGTLDMKGGITVMIEVARYLLAHHDRPNVTLFFNSDEEIASPTSGPILREIAADSTVALVYEFSTHEGVYRVGARGVRWLKYEITGKGGHAAYPEHMLNPVDALVDVLAAARQLNDPKNGLVVTPTMVAASEVPNAVSDKAVVHIDVRGTSDRRLDELEKRLARIRPSDERFEVQVERVLSIPTFEYFEDNLGLDLAKRASSALGLPEPQGIEGRGASDANQIASVLPHAIEGFGGWGDGMHNAPREYVHVSSLLTNAALTTLMIEDVLAGYSGDCTSVHTAR